MPTVYPIVPGHEIVGRVTKVGSEVTKYKPGDLAAVGCLVDSDRTCPNCKAGLEQFCPNMILTYNRRTNIWEASLTVATPIASSSMNISYCDVPPNLNSPAAAPLLCAGITTYSPMRHWNVGKGQKVGVVGLGGLGHMAVKFAHAFGAHVVVFTTSPGKKDDALRLGADEVVISRNADEMKKHTDSFRLHSRRRCRRSRHQRLYQFARRDGNITLVGAPEEPLAVAAFGLIFGDAVSPARLSAVSPNAGDARLLRRARHHLRRRSHPHPEGQRSVRATAQVRCEVPLLHRHGFSLSLSDSGILSQLAIAGTAIRQKNRPRAMQFKDTG